MSAGPVRMAAAAGGVWDVEQAGATTFAPGLDLRQFAGEGVSVNFVEMAAGVVVARHSHHHEQITYVLSGALSVTVDGNAAVPVRAGQIAYVAGDVPHESVASEDASFIEVFAPRREDLIAKAEELGAGAIG
jgi:quercetin dioxygenase-like cupin family protein